MKIENPAALRFIIQDDVYLLQTDKKHAGEKSAPEPAVETASVNLNLLQTDKNHTGENPVAEPVVEPVALNLNYLGKHKKNFLVVVHYPEHEFIANDHLTALENILKRKDYSIDDVAVFNIAKNKVDFDELTAHFNPQKLLLLGKNAIPEKMAAPVLNQSMALANCIALYSFSFDEMMSNVEYKKIFWDQMKNL